MPIPTHAESSSGVQIAIHDLGGEGPLILFCHATGFHGHMWTGVAGQLHDRYHCVAMDFRGHGQSTLPAGATLDWPTDLADDVLAVVSELRKENPGLGPIRAVGHSMGGGAIALAEDRNPKSFVSAWAFEPVFIPKATMHKSEMAENARRRRSEFDSRDAAYERYGSRPPFNAILPEALRDYVDYGFVDTPEGTVRLACDPQTEAGVFDAAPASGSAEAVVRIHMPYAIGVGNDDDGVAGLLRILAAEHEDLDLIEFELSHFGPFEDPAMIAESIDSWFSQH